MNGCLTVYDKKKVMGYYYPDSNGSFLFVFDEDYYKNKRNTKIKEILSAAEKMGVKVQVRTKMDFKIKKRKKK
jgi:hypothetical protein